MNSIKDLLTKPLEKPKSLRHQLIDEAFIELNKGLKKPKYSKAYIGMRIGDAKVDQMDIHFFLNNCRNYAKKHDDGFAKCFFGSLKPKPWSL